MKNQPKTIETSKTENSDSGSGGCIGHQKTVKWSNGQMVKWSNGQMVKRSNGQMGRRCRLLADRRPGRQLLGDAPADRAATIRGECLTGLTSAALIDFTGLALIGLTSSALTNWPYRFDQFSLDRFYWRWAWARCACPAVPLAPAAQFDHF